MTVQNLWYLLHMCVCVCMGLGSGILAQSDIILVAKVNME